MKKLLILAMGLALWSCSSTHRIVIPKGGLPTFFDYSASRMPLVSAHRGGRFLPGYPENCVETFTHILELQPATFECDVSMTRDSVLVLLHDNTLDRTTNGEGHIKTLQWKALKPLRLVDDQDSLTRYRIPKLKSALGWAKGKTILSLDVKRGVPISKVVDLVEKKGVEDYVVLITYSVEDAALVHRLNPELMISISARDSSELAEHLDAGIPADRMLAFTGTQSPDASLMELLHRNGIPAIFGTFSTADKQAEAVRDRYYDIFLNKGVDILATDRPLVVGELIRPQQKADSVKGRYIKWPKEK